jgi:translation initiation factor 2A
VCLGGFGNLNGEMEIWDLATKKKIGTCKSNSASYCGWSTDDRKLVTAILTPRLRVDNCYKIFSYTGVLLHKANYEHTELYETVWLNNNLFTEKDARGLSPGRKSGGEAKVEPKFKSFGGSLNFDPYANNFAGKTETGPKLVPGQHPDDIPKKKKRRNRNEPKLEP